MKSVAAVSTLIALGVWACESNSVGPASVASVSVAPDTATIMVGMTRQLTATPRDESGKALSNRAVTWESGDPAIATVSATGLVTGVGVGEARIAATSQARADTAVVTVLEATGTLQVLVTTSGVDQPARYQLVTRDSNMERGQSVLPNDTVTFQDVHAGRVHVRLTDVATNCAVAGENPRPVDLSAGQTVQVVFTVTCAPLPTRLVVVTATTGVDLDANGYQVDAFTYNEAGGSGQTAAIGVNDSVTLVMAPDTVEVEVLLEGVAWNCTVVGENPRTVTVAARQTTRVAIAVTCAAFPNLVVTTATTGGDLDPDGYEVVVSQASYDNNGGVEVVLAVLSIGVNDSVTFSALNPPDPDGQADVYLRGVARNCTGPGSEPVDLVGGQTTHVALAVTCVGFGSIAVNATTTGVDLDGNGYSVLVTDGDGAIGDHLPVNGSVRFNVLPGNHRVTVHDVATNCSVEGGADRTVTATSGDTTAVLFDVTCVATGSVTVSVTTTGVNLDPDGYYLGGPTVAGPIPVPVNGSVTFADVAPGSRTVTLYDVVGNCVVSGGARRTVTVTGGETTAAAFAVSCEPVTQIAFVSNGGIYLVNTDGTDTRPLTSSGVEPAWSPDGTRLAFASDRGGNWDIYLMNADGSGPVRLTTDLAKDRYPAWAPDGARIAFVSEHGGTPQIYVMNADGSGATRLATDVAAYAPSWSPDGTRIAFAGTDAAGTVSIYVMNADGSNLTRIPNGLAQSDYPAWSPDGVRIAFRTGAIYLMNADGSGVTQVTFGESRPAWSPDGTRIAYGSEDCYADFGCYPILLVVSADGTYGAYLSYQGNLDPAWRPQ